MKYKFANRMNNIPQSFIREILKVTIKSEIISFAGGLPNPDFFPVKEIQAASNKILESDGKDALQYNITEGYFPLRQYIAETYYKQQGLNIKPEEIIITNGSQQAIDLLGKIFINEKDKLIIEKPGYLGAIQAFSIYKPKFFPILLEENGIDIEELAQVLKKNKIKMFYAVTNFQNPTGITYSETKRKAIAKLLKNSNIILIEDDPYHEFRFLGQDIPSMRSFYNETVLLGSFSKMVLPSFRLGWLVAPKPIMEKIIIAKQAADLHTNYFGQRIIYQYLIDNYINVHLNKVKASYRQQRNAMIEAMQEYFPENVKYTKPEGGMFIWVTLPKKLSSLKLLELTFKENVIFVPGPSFYINGEGVDSLRLNFSCTNVEIIQEGIKRLGMVIKKMSLKN